MVCVEPVTSREPIRAYHGGSVIRLQHLPLTVVLLLHLNHHLWESPQHGAVLLPHEPLSECGLVLQNSK